MKCICFNNWLLLTYWIDKITKALSFLILQFKHLHYPLYCKLHVKACSYELLVTLCKHVSGWCHMYYKNNIIVKDRSRQQRSSATPNCSSVTVNGGQPCMYTLESLVQNASWVIDLEIVHRHVTVALTNWPNWTVRAKWIVRYRYTMSWVWCKLRFSELLLTRLIYNVDMNKVT